MDKVSHYARQLVLLCCLLPATFLQYPSFISWLRALRGGKTFFKVTLANARILRIKAVKRGRLCAIVVGLPLLFAMQIRQQGVLLSLRQNVKRIIGRKGFFPCAVGEQDSLPPLRQPGVVDLLLGLNEGTPSALRNAQELLHDFADECISIDEHVVRVHGKDDFAGETVVVVAHWDMDARVDPYVRYMLDHFSSLGWKTVFASANPIQDDNLEKLADAVLYRTCPGYDFTSWKAALSVFPSLLQSRELVLCNDSVFGAIGSYAPMHEVMNGVDCDFWGITMSREIMPHLQSYHMVFREKALRHEAFIAFFNRVRLSDDRTTAISYETRFSLWLANHGLRPGAFASLSPEVTSDINPSCEYWKHLLEAGVPLIKRELLYKNDRNVNLNGWASLLSCRGYPLERIFTYFWRKGVDLTPTLCEGLRSGEWPSDVLSLQDAIDLDAVNFESIDSCPQKPLGVFAHIYYTHLLPEMGDYLRHLPHDAHLYVSTDTEQKATEIYDAFKPLGFDILEIRVLPNKGWDIAPFMLGFADVFEQYPLILRVHAKCSAQIDERIASDWRNMLFSSLMGSKDRVRRIQALFAQNTHLGMLCPPPTAYYAANITFARNFKLMRRLLEPFGVPIYSSMAIDFPMGSMFWCRPEVLKPWLEQHLTFNDFVPTDVHSRDGSLAHALERLFFFGCGISGLRWGRIPPVGYNQLSPRSIPVIMPTLQNVKHRLKRIPLVRRSWEIYKKVFHRTVASIITHQHVSVEKTDTEWSKANVVSSTGRSELVVILPRVSTATFSGGPNTVLLFAAEIAKAGYDIHCLSQSPPTCSNDVLRAHLRDLLSLDAETADHFRVSCMSEPFKLHSNDRLCASAWWTVPVAEALAEQMESQRFFYFIQDFEPLFYPWNEMHAKAVLSYEANFLPVMNEPCLADFFFNFKPGRFAEPTFQREALVFMPAVDRKHFYPEPRKGKHILLFYARPSAPRNLYHYGMEAMHRLVLEGLITADTWEIHCMGEETIVPTVLDNGVVTRIIPWLSFADYAARVRQASVGLSLMLSPHTSYMPLELAACGVPVVTTTYINKNTALLESISPQLIGVEPTVEAIVNGLRTAVLHAMTEEPHKDALQVATLWTEAFAPIMPRVLRFMQKGD